MMRRVAFVVGVSATAFGAVVVEEAAAPGAVVPLVSQQVVDKAKHGLKIAHVTHKADTPNHGLKVAHITPTVSVFQKSVEEKVISASSSEKKKNAQSGVHVKKEKGKKGSQDSKEDDAGEEEEDDEACDEEGGCDDDQDEEEGCDGDCEEDEDGDEEEACDGDCDDDAEEDDNDDESESEASHDSMFQELKFEEASADQLAVLAQVKKQGKPAMVVITKKTCPHCGELGESMLENSKIQKTLKKFSTFHVKDEAGKAWGQDTYVPRTYFFNSEGMPIDVHSPNKKYPYFFKNSASLLKAMKKVLA